VVFGSAVVVVVVVSDAVSHPESSSNARAHEYNATALFRVAGLENGMILFSDPGFFKPGTFSHIAPEYPAN
jgi:hypothetical protein